MEFIRIRRIRSTAPSILLSMNHRQKDSVDVFSDILRTFLETSPQEICLHLSAGADINLFTGSEECFSSKLKCRKCREFRFKYLQRVAIVTWIFGHNYFCMSVYVSMSVCLYACMSVCLYVCMSVCLYVCMSVCLYVCMSVCRLYICMSRTTAMYKKTCINAIY